MRKPLLAAALITLLTTSLAAADWQAGVEAYRGGNFSQAAQEFQAVVDDQPDWPGGHLMLGQALLKLDRADEAVTHLRRAYDLNSEDVQTQFALGTAYVEAGRYADGATVLSKINASALQGPQRATLSQVLAVALDRSGQSDAALAELAKAAQGKPDDAALQYQYGTTALNAGDTAAAIQALRRATQLAGSAEHYGALTRAYIRQGRESQGEAKQSAYRNAAEAAGRLVAAEGSYDNLMLQGEAQLGAKQYDAAIATFERAAGQNSSDWLPHFYIGQAYGAGENFARAEQPLRRALQLTSDREAQNRIHSQLGFTYEKLKQWDQAEAAYRQAGNGAALERVATNRATAEENARIEEQNRLIEELQAEREALQDELEALPGSVADDDEDDDPPSR